MLILILVQCLALLFICYFLPCSRPCDISGDVSYEELRAAAYEDAKRGLNLQAIVKILPVFDISCLNYFVLISFLLTCYIMWRKSIKMNLNIY